MRTVRQILQFLDEAIAKGEAAKATALESNNLPGVDYAEGWSGGLQSMRDYILPPPPPLDPNQLGLFHE